jgi:hypothetical protein
MQPVVPELSSQPPIDFGRFGEDLRIVVPEVDGPADRDQKALRRMAELIVDKARRAKIVATEKLTAEDHTKTLLVLGTPESNSVAQELLKNSPESMAEVRPGGYAIQPIANPWAAGKQCIVALGQDGVGAWGAAEILAFSIHPEKEQLGALRNWPVQLPEGTYWLPFEAKYTLDPWSYEKKPLPSPIPPKPAIPFGVRIWGSPMPTLESYQRVIRSLAQTGMNTVVVQSGGWVDLPDAPKVFTKALDIAWQEGLYTILYVGNEEVAHLPAPLSPAHQAVVLATRDHPGLLGWHLYNQLAAKLTPDQRDLVRAQLAWLRSVSDKPIGNEVVWGHNAVEIPGDKQTLIRDLKSWGNDIIATDYAPIGGWTKVPELSRWEARLRELAKLDVRSEAVLQGHVPFLEPTVPRREELRNQFWWCVAGGAQGFYVETAYLFTHFSVRGLLDWTGKPLPDGRYDEVCELAATTRKLEHTLLAARRLDDTAAAKTHVGLVDSRQPAALRLFAAPDGVLYALVINHRLDREAAVRMTILADDLVFRATDVLADDNRGRLDQHRQMLIKIPPGGAAVYELSPLSP